MVAGVGVGVSLRVHWTGETGKGLGRGFSGVRVAGNMVTLSENAGGVSVGTLGDGAGQSLWSAPARGCTEMDRTGVVGDIAISALGRHVWVR